MTAVDRYLATQAFERRRVIEHLLARAEDRAGCERILLAAAKRREARSVVRARMAAEVAQRRAHDVARYGE